MQHLDYPGIATELCHLYAKSHNDISETQSIQVLKQVVAEQIAGYPDPSKEKGGRYEEYFEKLNFDWIVTTNYDSVVETLLQGKALPLLTHDAFVNVANLTPVCHIHGSAMDPSSIVITQDDYTRFFRAGNYWQARMPFLIKEHLVLMLGYGIGDSNITSAMDWCDSVYKNDTPEYSYPVVQVNYTDSDNASEKPYIKHYGDSEIYVIDTNSLTSLLDELMTVCDAVDREREQLEREIENKRNMFNSSDDKYVLSFIKNETFRHRVLDFMKELGSEYGFLWSDFLSFFDRVIAMAYDKPTIIWDFPKYAAWLRMLIDIGARVDPLRIPPKLFHQCCDKFNDVVGYISYDKGSSWEAADVWRDRGDEIGTSFQLQMYRYFVAQRLDDSRKLLEKKFSKLRDLK
nr:MULTISPECIES: SIR2 family protein [Bifidobacterium]